MILISIPLVFSTLELKSTISSIGSLCGRKIVCGCLLNHQVVNPLFTLLCAFPSWVEEVVCASGLYPSSCEVILTWLSANPSSCEVIVCWLGVVPQGGGCVCKERSWVLLVL